MENKADRVRKNAENYYRNGDFYCSEAIVKAVLEEYDYPMSDEIVKLASGFPVGVGGQGCICGAVSGGIMCIGMFYGRKKEKDEAVNKTMMLSSELYKRFTANHKHTCCKILTRSMELGSEKHMEQCIALTGEVAYHAVSIIEENK